MASWEVDYLPGGHQALQRFCSVGEIVVELCATEIVVVVEVQQQPESVVVGVPVPVPVPGNWSEPMLRGKGSEPMLGGNWSEPYWSETAGIWSGSGDAGGPMWAMSPIVPNEATAWATAWPRTPDIFGGSSWFGGDWQCAPWPMMPAPSVDD